MDDEVITAAGETASADCPSSEESASLPTEASDSWADVDIDGLDVMPLSLGAYDGVKLGLSDSLSSAEVVKDEETSEGCADIIDIVGVDVGAEEAVAYDGVKLGLCSGADEVGIDEVGLAVEGWLDVLGAVDDDPADDGPSDRIIVGALVCIVC